MARTRGLILVAAVIATAVPLAAGSANVFGDSQVIVGHVDTGVRATHQEFTYGGPSSTTDQFAAWWDFTDEKAAIKNPASGQLWDTRNAPYDLNGHGTGTAALAVGRNAAGPTLKDPSFAPGTKLAVAKVGNGDGSIPGDIAAAVRWLVDTAKADVITISIGPIVPILGVLETIHDATEYAREAGVLVLFANGNGYGNLGLVPGDPGWASPYAGSTAALAVGADGLNSFIESFDPEVVAKYGSIRTASNSCNTCYTNPAQTAGTSYSTPLVAGMAAKLVATAIANGKGAGPDYIERLLKYSAVDRLEIPPTFEGYGVLNAAAVTTATNYAKQGTLPARPATDVNGVYGANIQDAERDLWTEKMDGGIRYNFVDTGVAAPSAKNVLGPSLPEGPAEGEIYRLVIPAKASVTITMKYVGPNPANDIDLMVFKAAGPHFSGEDLTAASFNAAGASESVTFTSPAGGTYSVVVLGWSVITDQPVALTSTRALTFLRDGYLAAASSLGALD